MSDSLTLAPSPPCAAAAMQQHASSNATIASTRPAKTTTLLFSMASGMGGDLAWTSDAATRRRRRFRGGVRGEGVRLYACAVARAFRWGQAGCGHTRLAAAGRGRPARGRRRHGHAAELVVSMDCWITQNSKSTSGASLVLSELQGG
ncbi:Os09g0376500 [Oryza sativa Japonica Group]|uniref:Os09g0376500 protein n=1 Tax=Oryza sativa subsp. japonica TaxID=39947 RepID=A0A0P0XKZ0_ORYSJ|nr:Os09g0376500 [Oryza sativa Japonica Group]